MDLLASIKKNAISHCKKIVLPEGTEERTLKAADIALQEQIAKITLLGDPDKIQEMAKLAYQTLDCNGLVRIDFMFNEMTNQIIVLEVNTIPGSLSFYLWEPKGLKFKDLLTKLINLALERYEDTKKNTTSFPSNILANFNPQGKASKI